jgi:heat shock protein HslJ/uncharacterized membrane protein
MRINISIIAIMLVLATGCAGIRHLPEQVSGTYYGYLPCANCPGIFYELQLNPDRTYSEVIRYDDQASKPVTGTGSFRVTRDSVVILSNNYYREGMNQFAIRNGNLEMLSSSGEKIETGFPERYILKAEKFKPSFEEITVTGFRATGNEPFWHAEIEFGNLITFNTLAAEGFEFTAHYPDPEKVEKPGTVKFSARTHNGDFHLTINRQECIDNMSGEAFPYSVLVAARRSHRESYRRFEGCGQFMGSYRLNDIWVLEKVNDQPVSFPDSKELPTLHIDLAAGTVSGNGGCNRFNGKAELVNNRLVIGQVISTRMACPETQQVENRFLETISDKTLDFSIQDSTLVLGDGTTKLTFSRAG